MLRLLFSKTGDAIWISHLDTMRLFQRAFKRSGLNLKHTQGFNPRPSVSIALPLSVGVESECEILDFELDGQDFSCDRIKDLLNQALIPGVYIHAVYEDGMKIKYLKYLHCCVYLEYDHGIPCGAEEGIRSLFAAPSLVMEKKGKNGMTQQDLIPMIRSLNVLQEEETVLRMEAVICCQDPALNPAQLSAAVVKYLPAFAPDFSKCRRLELYDGEGNIFR